MDFARSRLLRRKEVLLLCAISKSALYGLVADGSFPAPVRVGSRSVRWRAEDVITWLEARSPAKPATPTQE